MALKSLNLKAIDIPYRCDIVSYSNLNVSRTANGFPYRLEEDNARNTLS